MQTSLRVRTTSAGAAMSGAMIGAVLCVHLPPAQAQPTSPASPAAIGSESPDRFTSHIMTARAHIAQQRYRDALAEWNAAYEIRQHPDLLLELARTQQRLGMTQESVASYRRFLTAHESASPESKHEAMQAIARLSALLPPPPVQLVTERSDPPYRVVTRPHHRGMVAAGWTLLSLGYAVAFGTGIGTGIAWNTSSRYTRYPSSSTGWTLLIPVAGPLISSIVAPVTGGSTYAYVWTLPWLLADLPFQIIGTALLIKGYRTPQKVLVPSWLASVQLHPYANQSGGGTGLSGAF